MRGSFSAVIDSYDSEKRRIFQDFSESTRFTDLHSFAPLHIQFFLDFFFFFREREEKGLHFFSPDRGDCRSRKMLKNAPTLAIVAVDTAENGPSKVRQVTNKVYRNIGMKRKSLAWR